MVVLLLQQQPTRCLHKGGKVELPRVDKIKQLVMQWLTIC